MTEQLKFKAWHKAEQKLCNINVLTPKGAFLLGVKTEENSLYNGGKFEVIAPTDGRFCDHEEIVILQYIGLKDKNGDEIYNDFLLSDGKIMFRVYQAFGGFVIKSHAWAKDMTDLNQSDQLIFQPLSDLQTAGWITENCEIVGNIYQNPELVQ